ncbi:MAG: MFS transporter [Rhizobiales bacterium]|nr:MFS transporter [Hyphomicrobiales bacterium]MBI3674195.1 MFS transporter [Hyphomicrobiales bacterium]
MSPIRIVFTALLPFASGYFMSYLLRAVNAAVAPDLVRDAGLSPAELGLLTAAYLGAFALFQLPLGVLLDRYGPRRVQSGLLLVAAAGCVGFALAPGFAAMFAARSVIGLGFSAGLMASFKSSANWVPIEWRSLANTSIMAFGALGVVAATVPTELLVGQIGWRGVFLVFAALIVAASALIFAVAPSADTGGTTPAPFRRQAAELVAILRLPLFHRVAPLLALTSGLQIGIQTLWAGPWFRDNLGLSRPDVDRHLLWMALAFMAGILSVGVIADRLGRRGIGPMPVMLGCNCLYFVAQAIIVARIEALAVPAWLVVAGLGQVAILAFPWFAARVGEGLAGRSNATINFTMFVAAFFSQYVAGLIIGLFPATATGYDPRGYSWALGLFLALQLVAFAWYFLGAWQHRKDVQHA